AFQLRSVADINSHGAHLDALVTVNAIASFAPVFALPLRPAWLTTVIAIGNIQGVLVGQRSLNARPGTHIGADLFSHHACEEIGRQCQDSRKPTGRQGRFAGKPATRNGWCVMPVEDTCPAGPERNDQPDDVLADLAPELAESEGGLV